MKIKCSHGIMFHNFHDNFFFKKIPGSISKNQLKEIINYYKKKNIFTKRQYIYQLEKKNLIKNFV